MSGRSSSRRGFLQAAGACLAAAAGVAGLGRRPAAGIEPIQRSGTPKFRFSLAAYSYRDLLNLKQPKLTLFDFLADCAAMQLDAAELTSYYFPEDVTPEFLRRVKADAFRLGLDVSGTAVGNDLCLPKGPKRDAQLELVKRWVDRAEILGAPVIRIFSGKQGSGQLLEEAHRLAVEGMEECCDYAGQHGVFLALENHGGLTATAEGLLQLVRDVKSPWFGVNVDTGNFHSTDPYAELEQIAPYALNVQVKVVMYGEGRKTKTPADFARLAKIMRGVGYRGYVVLEYEETEDPRAACPRYVDELRQAFA